MRVVETSNLLPKSTKRIGIGIGTEQEHDDAQSIHSTSLPLPLPLLDQVLNLYGYYIILLVGKDLVVVGYDSSCEFVNDACSTRAQGVVLS